MEQRITSNGAIDFFVNMGLSDKTTIENSLKQAKINNQSLIKYLTTNNIIDSQKFAEMSASFLGLNFLDIKAYDKNFIPKKFIYQKIILEHHCLPLYKNDKTLILAISNPLDLNAVKSYRAQTGLNIEYFVVDSNNLSGLIDYCLQQFSVNSLYEFNAEDLDDIALKIIDENIDQGSSFDEDDAPIIKFINKIIIDAINNNASDIHFEPYEKNYRIRYRIDGILQIVSNPSNKLSQRISARLKIMAKLNIAEKRIPQDGHFKLKISQDNAIDFRVSTCPAIFGEKIVLRVLDASTTKIGIEDLGFEKDQQLIYEQALKLSQGMIIITGPTGSGKTVTLYSGINLINSADKNISTAEDPVEINIEGINQVHINNKQGLTFAVALKAFLRQDPDIIMVGEIRDLETGNIAIKAAQTGHLVLSTLHTNSAPETLNRMVDMGIAQYNIATAVSLIIAQRLVRKLCDNCKMIDDTLSSDKMLEIGFTQKQIDKKNNIYIANNKGCQKCFSGYKGRVGVYEVMPVTPAISKIIIKGGNTIDIAEQAQKDGVLNIYQSALVKVLYGLTSIEEVKRISSLY